MSTPVVARVFSPAALREARRAAGRSQREVAAAAGLRKTNTITDYELGRVSPQADDLAAIAIFLGVDIIEFFPQAGSR